MALFLAAGCSQTVEPPAPNEATSQKQLDPQSTAEPRDPGEPTEAVPSSEALVAVTHKSFWLGKPPLAFHTLDVTVQNPADGPRWVLIPDSFPYKGQENPAPGVGELGELQIYELSKKPPVIISNGVGANFWAVKLEAGARLMLRDLQIESSWEEIPQRTELEVLVATEVLAGGVPLEKLYDSDPTSKGGEVLSPKDAADERASKFWHPPDQNHWVDVHVKVESRARAVVTISAARLGE